MTDHTATLDRNDPEAPQINATWFVQLEGALIVHGGLRHHDPERFDAEVRRHARNHRALGITRAEAAHLAVALIRGHVTTHPEPNDAELDYLADLRALRRVQAARRRFQRAIWAAHDFNRAALDARRALVEFAHPVHNPVENDSRVVHQRHDCDLIPVMAHDGTVVREARA